MSADTYQVNPGPAIQLSGSPIPDGSMIINNDPLNTIWVSSVPTVSPQNGMPITGGSATNWNPLKKGGTLWACVDTGVTTPILITVTDDANTYLNAVANGIAIQNQGVIQSGSKLIWSDTNAPTNVFVAVDVSAYQSVEVQVQATNLSTFNTVVDVFFDTPQLGKAPNSFVVNDTFLMTAEGQGASGNVFPGPSKLEFPCTGTQLLYRKKAVGSASTTRVDVWGSGRSGSGKIRVPIVPTYPQQFGSPGAINWTAGSAQKLLNQGGLGQNSLMFDERPCSVSAFSTAVLGQIAYGYIDGNAQVQIVPLFSITAVNTWTLATFNPPKTPIQWWFSPTTAGTNLSTLFCFIA